MNLVLLDCSIVLLVCLTMEILRCQRGSDHMAKDGRYDLGGVG
jgi:hypothetical protein